MFTIRRRGPCKTGSVMRLRGRSQLDPMFMLGLAVAYLVLGTAELLLFVLGRHQVIQGLMTAALLGFAATWLAMYLRKRNRPPTR